MTDKKSTDGSDRELGTLLRDLFESIVTTDGDSHVKGHGSSNAPIGHEFSIGIGTLDDFTDAHTRGNQKRTRGDVSEQDATHATSVREVNDEGEIRVVVDLAGVDPETLSAGVNSRTAELVIAADSAIIERVALPRGTVSIADTWYNNAVLEFSLVEENG